MKLSKQEIKACEDFLNFVYEHLTSSDIGDENDYIAHALLVALIQEKAEPENNEYDN